MHDTLFQNASLIKGRNRTVLKYLYTICIACNTFWLELILLM